MFLPASPQVRSAERRVSAVGSLGLEPVCDAIRSLFEINVWSEICELSRCFS